MRGAALVGMGGLLVKPPIWSSCETMPPELLTSGACGSCARNGGGTQCPARRRKTGARRHAQPKHPPPALRATRSIRSEVAAGAASRPVSDATVIG